MSKVPMFPILAAAAWLTGCAPLVSLHPLVTQKDAILEPAFTGLWKEAGGDGVWKISKADASTYEYQKLGDGHDRGKFRLMTLGGQWFADIYDDSETVPAHIFGRVRLEGDNLHLAILGSEWLTQQVRTRNEPRREALAEEESKDARMILTAPTAELKKFVLRYAAAPEAFDEDAVLQRVK